MATKRASSEKKPTRSRKAAATAKFTDTSVVESAPLGANDTAGLDPEHRRQLVAAEAYFRAERRGFTAGHELDDWVAAEAAVDSQAHPRHMA
jgi:hypothetical protein